MFLKQILAENLPRVYLVDSSQQHLLAVGIVAREVVGVPLTRQTRRNLGVRVQLITHLTLLLRVLAVVAEVAVET